MSLAQLALEIHARWEELAHVRQRTVYFLSGLDLHADVVDAMAMVSCELSENAIKYGAARDAADRIHVTLGVSGGQVTAEVTNRIAHKDEKHLVRLDRTVQWIRGFHDPFEAYLHRLKELSSQALDNSDSRLGLVRIAYEGQSVLDFYVNDHDVLAVCAIRQL